jgi:outer membrane lipoprotein-sorting protein
MRPILRLSVLIAFALAIPGVSANPAAAGETTARFSDAEKSDLKRISDTLNGLKSVQGRFLQIGPDGKSSQGTFYLRKPGRVRFEYQRPNPNLIVADGTTVGVVNSALRTTDRYPLLNSPLRLLLNDNVDLAGDPRVAEMRREQGALSVTARERSGPATGSITLTLADSGGGLELRQWEVVDAQGARTLIVVNDLRQVADIPARMFVIEDLSPFKGNAR